MIGTLPNATTHPAPKIDCFLPESNPEGIGLVIFPDSDGHFENKPGIMRLASGNEFNTGYTIRVVK